MIPINPSQSNMGTFQQTLRWAQSVFKALNGSIEFAQISSQATGGEPNSFVADNIKCAILYIGPGATLTWAASNTGKAFNHGLLKQPIGFTVCYKNKTCDVYSTAVSDTNNVYLACTDSTATVKIMVF